MPGDLRTQLNAARRAAMTTAADHLTRAAAAFEDEDYPLACFLAMTAIEEAGKCDLLFWGSVAADRADSAIRRNRASREVARVLRDHTEKARIAATSALYINSGATRRMGKHPESGMYRIDGVVLLARSKEWMSIRNRCLYVDVDSATGSVVTPRDAIGKDLAYYFVVAAYEVLAELAERGVGPESIDRILTADSTEAIEFWKTRIDEVEAFIARWSDRVDLDMLPFLRHPEPLREKANTSDLKRRES